MFNRLGVVHLGVTVLRIVAPTAGLRWRRWWTSPTVEGMKALIAIVVVVIVVVVVLVALVLPRRRARSLEHKQAQAADHLAEAQRRTVEADATQAAADEQAARARRERAEAELRATDSEEAARGQAEEAQRQRDEAQASHDKADELDPRLRDTPAHETQAAEPESEAARTVTLPADETSVGQTRAD
jgi:F0F1-type ATP synthase membrane subunit b/b'